MKGVVIIMNKAILIILLALAYLVSGCTQNENSQPIKSRTEQSICEITEENSGSEGSEALTIEPKVKTNFDSDTAIPNNTTSSVSTKAPSSYGIQELPWGNAGDKLKKYATQEGNQYKDYTMLTWMELPDTTSQRLTLTASLVGTQFLSELSELEPLNMHEPASTDGFVTYISITQGDATALYSFHENGRIYTKQNGKRYYLGEDDFKTHYYTMIYLAAAFNVFEGDIVLPSFDIMEGTDNTIKKENVSQYIRKYTASDYQVFYVATDYGEQSSPLIIERPEHREYVLKTLSCAWTAKESEWSTGTGQIIRLHNPSETLNFMVTGDALINYQVYNDDIVFQLPPEFSHNLQYIAAKEIAYKLRV